MLCRGHNSLGAQVPALDVEGRRAQQEGTCSYFFLYERNVDTEKNKLLYIFFLGSCLFLTFSYLHSFFFFTGNLIRVAAYLCDIRFDLSLDGLNCPWFEPSQPPFPLGLY